MSDRVGSNNELGVVICRVCNDVLYTLPTNGYKKFYSVCTKPECSGQSKKGEVTST
jgi:hypothetical protein